ncbi:MAG: DegT/DnrJ/EryC1/StrS family aminotransferase [Verrucomicrobia bacterium]|nr:DegT/DnrJ/EryC1/StrS family aminotransferase [Verrucomicrobiota bacterium]MBT7067503.1 DegT/DnrJ/EryC1/StrS family aminotransferase [Verrucomicrobiota bacterium]MBT7698692.1 DegT/DnrJ/EryC1/StrS family aminotransferase [Verrucomicrobiota bacterium]
MKASACDRPALEGGTPLRRERLPLFFAQVSEEAIRDVGEVLRSGWLATGAHVDTFETRFAAYVGVAHAVALTSGTQALELALEAMGVGDGDDVITTPLTFVATAHAIMNRGARPVLVDIDRTTWTLDAARLEAAITPRSRCILPVHFAGRPSDMAGIAAQASAHGLPVLGDGAHAIEARAEGRNLATWGTANAYSFHPCKALTTGEGGMVVTHDAALAERVRKLRFHGLVVAEAGSAWARDVTGPGHKANMSNLQAVLGLRQLEHLESRYAHRCALVARYRHGLQDVGAFELPAPCQPSQRHAWHLFTILLKPETLRIDRQTLISAMASENIEVGIHYRPLHCLSYLQDRYGFTAQSCPVATDVAGRILSLPLHAAMREADVDTVVAALARVADYYAR